MNSLSWLIYAADVVGRAGAMFVVAGVEALVKEMRPGVMGVSFDGLV